MFPFSWARRKQHSSNFVSDFGVRPKIQERIWGAFEVYLGAQRASYCVGGPGTRNSSSIAFLMPNRQSKICVSQMGCFPGKGENLQNSAKICENARFVPLGFSPFLKGVAPRAVEHPRWFITMRLRSPRTLCGCEIGAPQSYSPVKQR